MDGERNVKWKSLSRVRLFATPWIPWNSPGQNTGVGSLSLLQGIFSTQGSNPGLPHCTWILYQLSHQGSPRILEWVASPFSSKSSQSRNRTGVSCIAGRFFTNWVIRADGWRGYQPKPNWSWRIAPSPFDWSPFGFRIIYDEFMTRTLCCLAIFIFLAHSLFHSAEKLFSAFPSPLTTLLPY